MKPPPWFPFYAQDFLGATSHWTSEERGAYLSLMCHQWREGSVPKSKKMLKRICVEVSDEALRVALSKFEPMPGEPDKLVNPRLATEWDKAIAQRAAYHARASKGGQAAAAKRAKSSASSTATSSAHSPLTTHSKEDHSDNTTQKKKKKRAREKRYGEPKEGYSEEFLEFWAAYPSKANKPYSSKCFERIENRPPLKELLEAITRQKQSRQWKRGVIPNPSTWLNQARWNDDLPKATSKRSSTTGAAPGENPEDYDAKAVKWEGVH